VQLTLCGERGAATWANARGWAAGPPARWLEAPRAVAHPGEPVILQTRDVPPRVSFALEQAGVHPLLARLLAARGVRRPTNWTTAWRCCCRPKACWAPRSRRAAGRCHPAQQRRICIVADYDCDGATACAVALRGLRLLGADAAPRGLRGARPGRARLRPDAGHRRPGAGAAARNCW
jgi:hypothetical protein